MFAGYVGADYRPGVGLLLLAINPGGGGDAYENRTAEDQMFIPLLTRFKQAGHRERLESFECVNAAFSNIVKGWKIWTILKPTLDAAGVEIEAVAYMNIVPYRTRGNRMPPVMVRERAWKRVVGPSLEGVALLRRPFFRLFIGIFARGRFLFCSFCAGTELRTAPTRLFRAASPS